ncbi:MAG TPA: hypothetical protein VKU38_20065 [Ktedonobacteraceae bacterium]|nr:hypothetical protein [Ktedonobacteraceae bacterium]
MSKLEYNRNTCRWEGSIETDEEFFRVYMTDETFRTHYDAYLENLGIPTQTYLEMIAYVDKVGRQQYEAMQEFTADVERWRTCKDTAVRTYVHKYRRKVAAIEDKETQ